MKYYGNYKHLIKPEWIELILSTKGTPISPWKDHKENEVQDPVNFDQTLSKTQEEKNLFVNGAYNDNLIMAEIFTKENIPFKLDLGELNKYLQGDWWIVKQKPGQFMPIHRDTVNKHDENFRFWMPWLDYQEGHIFIHEGQFINNYRAGDLYRYNKDNDLHGSVNIGLTPRIILQISQKELP